MKRIVFVLAIITILLIIPRVTLASERIDSDRDGVPDFDEINIYKTDPKNADTDYDGFSDAQELRSGFSPLNPERIKLENSDYDNDGLTDRMELNFHTDLANPDTDGDGYKDGQEISNGFDPLSADAEKKLEKKIEVNLIKQQLSYFLGGVRLNTFLISSGINNTTPKGVYTIKNKSPKAWSPYGLWMPYWLGIYGQKFGIHELPIWPNGYREGENHLGKPVSHGCIRLGIGPAKLIYDWAEIGTKVKIY